MLCTNIEGFCMFSAHGDKNFGLFIKYDLVLIATTIGMCLSCRLHIPACSVTQLSTGTLDLISVWRRYYFEGYVLMPFGN